MTVEEKKEATKKTESVVDAKGEEPKKNVGEQFSACLVVTLIALVTIVGLSVGLAFRIRAIERCVAQLYPPVPNSDVVVFWYKPHYQVRFCLISIVSLLRKFESKAAAVFCFALSSFLPRAFILTLV